MFGLNTGRLGSVGSKTTIQRAISILRRYGQDAHIYLPGVGMLNGLQAGNYLDSAGTTQGTVDQPVGLVLDAAGGLGVELVTGQTWTTGSGNTAISGPDLVVFSNANQGSVASAAFPISTGKNYQIVYTVTGLTGGPVGVDAGGASASPSIFANGTYSMVIAAAGGNAVIYTAARASGTTASVRVLSVREVTGIAARQPTTSNKSVLKLTNGRYNWLFDSTDLLTATYPAGYESVTVIDARSTGQVTTAGANIVGAYSMGPSVTLYGRMIIRVAVSPSDLALLQGFANRLAGV